ncbi:MAG: MarR family transcriptional regulator [Candidatus Omnitrophica bacterium]|nr:MarR family transcriptional regulator [Candidatus Omnitrophota bacterium]
MDKKTKISKFSEELVETITYVHRLANSMLKRRADALFQGKITFPQYVALEALNVDKPLKMNNIAKILKISLPAVTGLINRLVIMKLAKRVYDQRDRRVIFIALTAKGKKIIEQTKSARKEIISDIFDVLSEAERQAYLGILRKIKRTFHEKHQK